MTTQLDRRGMGVRLDEEELRLVSGELITARWVAARYRTRLLSFEERLSAAYLGLCLAARRWGRRASFRTYAEHRMVGQIRRDLQRLARRRAHELPIGDMDLDRLAADDPCDDDAGLELPASLSAFEREVLWQRANGRSYRAICEATGTASTNAVYKAEHRAILKARAATSRAT